MRDVTPSLVPFYPFNRPGGTLQLYQGTIGGIGRGDFDGSIDFKVVPRPEVVWQVTPTNRLSMDLDDVVVDIEHPTGRAQLVAHRRSATDGWLSPAALGPVATELDHVLVHWLNLPAIRGPLGIEDPDGTVEYSGRWAAELGEWSVTLDRRSDHREIWRQVRADGSAAITHVMEVRRTDGRPFLPAQVEPVLTAMHVGMSFALGRWVAPALPVGFDAQGKRAWEQWGARHSEPGAPGALRWWHDQRVWELAELLTRTVEGICDPRQEFTTRFLMSSAILSAAGGFVEQRIMTAFAAMEHLTWVRLVLAGRMNRNQYKKLHGHERLAKLLAEAGIGQSVDEGALPALHSYSVTADDGPLDGPQAAARIRNAIVHPTAPQDELYSQNGLVTEAWFLVQQYLVLLILHHVGYTGSYQSMLTPGGWAGDVEPVPWHPQESVQS